MHMVAITLVNILLLVVVKVVEEIEMVVQIVLANWWSLDLVGLVPQKILDLVVESHRLVKPIVVEVLVITLLLLLLLLLGRLDRFYQRGDP